MTNCKCTNDNRDDFDARKAYDQLLYKHTMLSDIVAEYMSQAGLEREARTKNAEILVDLVARITGGLPTSDFPDCALLGDSAGFFCTGVLINPRVVLTAAHCQNRSRVSRVLLNATSASDPAREERVVSRVRVHPDYKPGLRINDISVLILASPAETPPVSFTSTEEFRAAADVTLVGYGNSDFASTIGFGLKRQVSVLIDRPGNVNNAEALFGYESDLEFVAGGNGRDTCNGDSGGPVYVVAGGQRKVAGLTSRATQNATRPCGDAGIYTRVDVHRDFIRATAEAAGIAL